MEQILKIAGFIIDSFIHIWPYLVVTIPLAVAVQYMGAAKFITKALSKNPVLSILLATIVGAFSPFCSCGVIPVISALLIGGVPLAPVMSFWIASPSMDPEIFFLSTAAIGWELSVWRLAASLIISLLSGFITHFAVKSGLLGENIIRNYNLKNKTLKRSLSEFSESILKFFNFKKSYSFRNVQLIPIKNSENNFGIQCCLAENKYALKPKNKANESLNNCACESSNCANEKFPENKLLREIWKATILVAKFMGLAFFVNALIQFYLPADFIANTLGQTDSPSSVVLAAAIGVPVYTSNITALPLIDGLLALGMNKGAALAFLISGPITTLPAMFAVWGIVRRRVFLMYLSYALLGAIATGLCFNFMN